MHNTQSFCWKFEILEDLTDVIKILLTQSLMSVNFIAVSKTLMMSNESPLISIV